MYFNIQAKNRKINEKFEKSTKKQEIGRLQTASQGRRMGRNLKNRVCGESSGNEVIN